MKNLIEFFLILLSWSNLVFVSIVDWFSVLMIVVVRVLLVEVGLFMMVFL